MKSFVKLFFSYLGSVEVWQDNTGGATVEWRYEAVVDTVDVMQRQDVEDGIVTAPAPGLYHGFNIRHYVTMSADHTLVKQK